MAEETQVQTQVTPPVVVTPPAVVDPPPVVHAQQPKKEFKEPPHQAFMNRVKREAAMEVKRRLGITIEEAEALVKKGGTQQASGDKSATDKTVDKALAEAKKEADALRKENEGLKSQSEAQKRKHEKEVRRLKNKQFEADLRAEIARSGIVDDDLVELALTKYSGEVTRATAEKRDTPRLADFLKALRESKPHLFGATTAPVVPTVPTVTPTTVPVETTGAPKPSESGKSPPAKTADDDTPEEFNARLRRNGWTPGS